MKKSILAIAVGTALAAGSAQAAVEVYGKLHLSLDQLDNGNTYNGNTNNATATTGSASTGGPANAGTKAKSIYVSSNSSVLGFKASEDLDGGLKAIAVMEFMVESDNPVSSVPLTEREVYGGLGGSFGTVRIGKIDTPTKLLGRKVDFFGDQIGDSRNLTARASGLGLVTNSPLHAITTTTSTTTTTGTTTTTKNAAGTATQTVVSSASAVATTTTTNPSYTYNTTQRPNWEVRSSNALAYTSPTMGGVTVALLYQPDEGRKDSSVKDLTAVLAGPAGPGKMLVGLGWASHGKAWNNDEKAESNLRFAGSFEISDFKIGLLYQKASNMNTVPTTAAGCAAQTVTVTTTNIATTPVSTGVTTNTSTVATATPACTTANTIKAVTAESLDRTTWGLGGSYKIGAGAVKAQYYKAGESKGAAVDPADGATMIAIGYDHNLSKNTKLYVAFSKTKNDDNGTLGPAGSGNNIPTKGSGYTAAAAGHSPNNVVAGTNANTINNGSDPKALSVGMVFTF